MSNRQARGGGSTPQSSGRHERPSRLARAPLLTATACVVVLLASHAHAQAAAAQQGMPAADDVRGGWTPCVAGATNTPGAIGAGRVRLVVRDGLMSVDVRGCEVGDLLPLLSAATGLQVTAGEDLPPQSISLKIDAQPVESALRQLLRGTDLFALYSTGPRGQELRALWIYPAGRGGDVAPVSKQAWASTRELEWQLADQDPDTRARATEALVTREGAAALPQVLTALADENSEVRQRALDAAVEADLALPGDTIAHLATADPSPEVRLLALQTLEGKPDAAATIRQATLDTDPDIRAEAVAMLARLPVAARRPAPSRMPGKP